jgi:hypothetical protein
MFELEPFGQDNRHEDNIDVMLRISISDDRESHVFQENVEV